MFRAFIAVEQLAIEAAPQTSDHQSIEGQGEPHRGQGQGVPLADDEGERSRSRGRAIMRHRIPLFVSSSNLASFLSVIINVCIYLHIYLSIYCYYIYIYMYMYTALTLYISFWNDPGINKNLLHEPCNSIGNTYKKELQKNKQDKKTTKKNQ